MSFLHGIETVELTAGVRPVRVVRSAVVGLVGIAPKGAINTPTIVYNDINAAQFGKQVPGFTIPHALDAIFKQGAGTVIVVNVFNPDTMTATVTAEVKTVANGKYTLTYAPIGTEITVTNNAGDETYVDGEDYSFDDFGVVTILNPTAIPNATVLKTTYSKLDAAEISNADIIGEVSGGGVRTGMQAFYDSFRLFGFNPKILIAPGYSHNASIVAEMRLIAGKFFGRGLVDAEEGTTTADAIEYRGTTGNAFNVNDKRIVLLHPHLQVKNTRTDETENRPYSQFFAGVWCSTIVNLGYQYSPSNKAINGIVGLEQPVTFNPLSPIGTDANELNAVGVVTAGNNFGSGLITWGNRSSSWPNDTNVDNFMAVLITADIIDESVMQASLVFVDKPIITPLIDDARETVNGFLRTLIGRGALVDGVSEEGRSTGCYFDEEKNPVEEIALGHITFTLVYMPPTPAERITYDRFIDVNFLRSLTAQ